MADDAARVPVEGVGRVAEDEMAAGRAGEVEVLVCRVGGILHALRDVCSHAGTPLSGLTADPVAWALPLRPSPSKRASRG